MKKIISLVLALVLVLCVWGASAEAAEYVYSVTDLIPDEAQWMISRTKFKENNGNGYEEVEIGGYKGLLLPYINVDNYYMDGYYEFAVKQGNYYGLSGAVYLVDVTKKMSDSELNNCYKTLVADMTAADRPTSSSKTRTVWEYSDCTVEITIDSFKAYNGSKNKTVAVIVTAADTGSDGYSTGTNSGAAQTMKVKASASCNAFNHVGQNWIEEFYVNGKKVNKNTTVSLSVGDVITVEAVITDEDSSPDIGYKSGNHTVTQSDLKNGFSIRLKVEVTEDGGRYKGYTASWNATFTFDR